MTAGTQRGEGPSRLFVAYLILTSMVCGALVMVEEVLGSRVIGPLFGVSLFVWTSLITVTLVALSLGYAAGGFLADRRQGPEWLYGIILLAGALVILIPFLKVPVLKGCLPLGLRSGALVSSLVLFGPSLFLLGCVSPYLIRIAAREMASIGRTVGLFYALSTVGSFIGTVLTGFVLIAWFRVNQIFLGCGVILIALAAGYFALFARRRALLILPILPLFLLTPDPVMTKLLPNGVRATKLIDRDTFYGNLKVVEYEIGPSRTREMMLDGLVQGGIDVNRGISAYNASYFLGMLPYGMNPGGRECLVIGVGPGSTPTWYERRGIRTDVVDINPEVIWAAESLFGMIVSGEKVTEDARYFLNNAKKRYDYVVLDVFNGETSPGHVLSIEAFRLIRDRMSGQGILAINFVADLRTDTFPLASVVRTLEQVFMTVEINPLIDPATGDGVGNVVILAYDRPSLPFNFETVRDIPVHHLAYPVVSRFMGKKYRLAPNSPGTILTDDYNPLDWYDIRIKEKFRKLVLEAIDRDVLL